MTYKCMYAGVQFHPLNIMSYTHYHILLHTGTMEDIKLHQG